MGAGTIVCGSGRACEPICPIRAVGRTCPSLVVALSEIASLVKDVGEADRRVLAL